MTESSGAEAAKPRKTGRPLPLHRLQQPSLTDVTVRQLRQMIVRGALAPGEKLSETALCDALGISRTPIREALKLLASEGLVELRRNRQTVVTLIDAQELAHLFEVQSGIESMAARLAAVRMTTADLKRLEVLQERMESHQGRGELDSYFEINQQIHQLVVAGAKNPVLSETHGWLMGRLERMRYMALGAGSRWQQSILEHREILAALKARDAEAAGSLFAQHVGRTGTVVADVCANDAVTESRRTRQARQSRQMAADPAPPSP